MKKIFFLLSVVILFSRVGLSQNITTFSEKPNEFIKQLKEFITKNKSKTTHKAFKTFEKQMKTEVFSEKEISEIIKTCNEMRAERLAASPYFTGYLTGLSVVKNIDFGEERFVFWHKVLHNLLASTIKRKSKEYHSFLKFSINFFENGALRFSKTGISWFVKAKKYEMSFEDEKAFVLFNYADIIGKRGKDTIEIKSTTGKFYPSLNIWKGNEGEVTWERHNLSPDVHVTLRDYEIDVTKSLYNAKNVLLSYPEFFGDTQIEGEFSDKTLSSKGGSYPRFESNNHNLQIMRFGKGVNYHGGFRLQGATVYGYGTKEKKAGLILFDEFDKKVFRGVADVFILKNGDKISSERVESTIYFGNDSLYHPSVNIRLWLNEKIIELTRGKRASDRNPFFDSSHGITITADNISFNFETDSLLFSRKLNFEKNIETTISFESINFFNKKDYRKFQNISTTNPIATFKYMYDETGEKIFDANLLARKVNPKLKLENIESLLYDLVSEGFIIYDSEKETVELKNKVFHYANANGNKVDYDFLRIVSKSKSTNAIFNVNSDIISINGVESIEFSNFQRVGMVPFNGQLILKGNRNLDFDGKLFAGYTTLTGKDFHFSYDQFNINLDSIRYFDIFLPTRDKDKFGNKKAFSIASRIEHFTGFILIDAPENKSGREDITMFPSLQSKSYSYVYYDAKKTFGGIYKRDSFYFRLDKFAFNSLDNFNKKALNFKGKMFSSGIFPPFKETITLMEDQSLGFISTTPSNGFKSYSGKGNYIGNIILNNKGFMGKGRLQYLGASIDSDDFIFKPKQTTASAENFALEEDRNAEIEIPKVRGYDVKIDWRPYQDSMYVSTKEKPFDLYQDNLHTLKGLGILTPGGFKGRGIFDWNKASMKSPIFSFGAYSVRSDTTTLKIKVFNKDAIALETSNLNGKADFDTQKAIFKANDNNLNTILPYNQYKTSMNEFEWDMKAETVTFKAPENKYGQFLSIHPDQDSLTFEGKSAFYDLKSNELKIGGVDHIVASDAFIFPDEGKIEIRQGGVISTLKNAKIIANTKNKYHVINRATVDILGKKEYRASGYYEYNIGNKKQEILFSAIQGTRIGKGKLSEKNTVTRATGELKPEDNFYIDWNTEFRGTINLSAEKKNLKFHGFARLNAKTLPIKHWFTIDCEADKKNLLIPYDVPKNYKGEPLRTGIFLSKEYAMVYPRLLMPLPYRKDRVLLNTSGYINYNKNKDRFELGDSLKIVDKSYSGNVIYFDNKTAKIRAEGKFNIGTGLKHPTIIAAGKTVTQFNFSRDSLGNPVLEEKDFIIDLLSAIDFILPEKLMDIIITDFKSSSFNAPTANYAKNRDFYKKAVSEIFPPSQNIKKAIDKINEGTLLIPKKENKHLFVFGKIPFKWNPLYQSFLSTKTKIPIVSVKGEPINKIITAYIEYKMPTNEDDRLYIYLKSPSGFYYFFGYKQGVMNLVSDNAKFMETLTTMKEKYLKFKIKNNDPYEVAPVNPGTATSFVERVKAGI